MRIVHADELDWQVPRSTHRRGNIAFKRMITGTPGAKDNFHWTLVRVGDGYYTPRHRHNYDQVRLKRARAAGKRVSRPPLDQKKQERIRRLRESEKAVIEIARQERVSRRTVYKVCDH